MGQPCGTRFRLKPARDIIKPACPALKPALSEVEWALGYLIPSRRAGLRLELSSRPRTLVRAEGSAFPSSAEMLQRQVMPLHPTLWDST